MGEWTTIRVKKSTLKKLNKVKRYRTYRDAVNKWSIDDVVDWLSAEELERMGKEIKECG